MRFETSPHLRMSQQTKLAPRMIQAMEILQLPAQELRERIEQELEENPALELAELDDDQREQDSESDDDIAKSGTDDSSPVGSSDAATRDERGERDARDERERPLEIAEDGASFEKAREFERSYGEDDDRDNRDDGPRTRRTADEGAGDRKIEAMANTPDRAETLVDSLVRQWRLAEVPEHMALVGRHLIAYADDDGLLGADLATIAEQSHDASGGPFTIEQLESALPVAQAFLEPPGILARDRRECLLIQIGARLAGVLDAPDPADVPAWRDADLLLREHYDDLLGNRVPHIVETGKITAERIAHAKAALRRLTLSPGSDLSAQRERHIFPDVIVEYDPEKDEYTPLLADGAVPSLRIAEQYRQMVKDRRADKATRQYLSERLRNANWLIDAVEQRQATLLRVVTAVISRQREWFDFGPEHLRPLPMGEVADQLGVHVATVSRAVSGKWLSTPRGLIELRRFFSGGVETRDGDSMSFEAIRTLVKEIVEAEDRSKPLSDQAIAENLIERGVKIARRTVVKYRDQLGIPAAKLRKVHV